MNVDFGLELAPVCRTDLEQLRKWRNDHRIWRWCRQSDLISDVEQEAWFRRQSEDPTIKMYVIVRRVDGERLPVGVCGLTSIDLLCRRAEFSLYVGPEHHRKGYGREALKLLLTHAFLNLGLNLVWGETIGDNPAAELFTGLGFQKDGTRPAFYFKDGRHVDAHLYSIRSQEWISSLSASASSASPASSPTPSRQEAGLKGGRGQVLDIKPTPRRRGPNRPKAGGESPSPSPTSELGSSSRTSGNESHP